MKMIENAVIDQVKNSYFEIELRHLVHSSDTECLFKDIIFQKAGEKITIKVLSNVNPIIITQESKVPHSTLDLNGNFHSKIYVNITDTPKILSEYLIDDLKKTFQDGLLAIKEEAEHCPALVNPFNINLDNIGRLSPFEFLLPKGIYIR